MAMTRGGLVVHGVGRGPALIGCPYSGGLAARIGHFGQRCEVALEVRALVVDDFDLTITAVPEVHGRVVTTPSGRLLRRVGWRNEPVPNAVFTQFILERCAPPEDGSTRLVDAAVKQRNRSGSSGSGEDGVDG